MKHMRNSKQGTTNQPTYIGNDYDKGKIEETKPMNISKDNKKEMQKDFIS